MLFVFFQVQALGSVSRHVDLAVQRLNDAIPETVGQSNISAEEADEMIELIQFSAKSAWRTLRSSCTDKSFLTSLVDGYAHGK